MRLQFLKPALAALVAAALAGCGGGSAETTKDTAGPATAPAAAVAATPPADPTKIEAGAYAGTGDPSGLKARRLDLKRAGGAVVDLGPLPLAKNAQATNSATGTDDRPGVPRQIGLRRDVAQTASTDATLPRLEWRTLASGAHVGTLTFRSPEAVGLRLGVQVGRLPGDAVLRVYAPQSDTALEVAGREVLATIDRNTAAAPVGQPSDASRLYWTPTVQGPEATLEIEVPAAFATGIVEVAVPQVSHLYRSAESTATSVNTPKIGQSASCEVDVSCRADYSEESKSVALMSYVEDGGAYVCTGTLLADRNGTNTPYFLSANHCIDRQATASTLETYWFYKSSSCNSGALNSGARRVVGGATLLYATTATDTAFMRLNAAPPAGAVFAGSSVTALTAGASVTGLHHPQGDLQKISDGSMVTNANCSAVSGGFTCSQGQTSSNYIAVRWSQGTTEGGSSGSGIFGTSGGKRYLVGQLYGGSASCATPTSPDFYGRFDTAFNAGLKQWLDPVPTGGGTVTPGGRAAVYRFYNGSTRAHFYTINAAERDYVIVNYRQFQYEGPAFYAYPQPASGLNPVFRFYNTATSAHFYTINADERAYVNNNLRQYLDEGATWYARTSADGTTQPVYRFYNPGSGNHFYTVSDAERDFIRNNDRSFVYEGPVYYAWGSQ